ncbi:MAG: RHS repeat-associated core domain-containing protein [Ectothiorhodospiraceae bacterium]|nr:RHS repeat-associated core domain-containing protein [Ectothiorhodospiraceae bacterium]
MQATPCRLCKSPSAQIENSALRGGCIRVLAGQYYDEETQLHYNYFRYYDPATGRYITSDPIGLEGGLNTYLYSLANPVKYTDPLGLNVGVGAGVVAFCIRFPAVCAAAAAASRPGWWPPDVPHSSDPPQDTQSYTEQCSTGSEPPNDPRERCVNGVNFIYGACMQSSANPIQCIIGRAIGLLACSVQNGDGDGGGLL